MESHVLKTAVADGINEFRAKEERFTFLIEKVLPATSKHKTPRGSAGKPVTLQGEKENYVSDDGRARVEPSGHGMCCHS